MTTHCQYGCQETLRESARRLHRGAQDAPCSAIQSDCGGRQDGPADTVATARLTTAVDALASELIAHAGHEDRFIHPLLREKAPILAAELDAAHEDLDNGLDELRRLAAGHAAATGDPNFLYRALAAFTATYLGHLAREEGEALPALWESCSDEELMSILVSFRGSRSDTENLTSMLAELATLNPPEIAEMASAGLGSVPASDLAEVLATLLDPRRYGALVRSLADPHRPLSALSSAPV